MSIKASNLIISDDLVSLQSETANQSLTYDALVPLQLEIDDKSIISSDLAKLETEFEDHNNPEDPNAFIPIFISSNDLLILNEGGREVGVRVASENIEELLPQLEELGFELLGDASEYNFVEGYIPIEKISLLESLESQGISAVRPIYQPITHTGSVTSQADFVQEVDRVRAALPDNYDGTGITIGILSDSYDNLGGEAQDIIDSDLPNDVVVIEDLSSGGSDEGRAIAQLIHDLAPGANLAFATAFTGEAGFADNIRALATAGADVIIDDVGYLAAPFFQDGVVTRAVDEVVTNDGVAYFSSAGNSADSSYESTTINFVSDIDLDSILSTAISRTYQSYYDFDPSGVVDNRQQLSLGGGETVQISLQWDDPFFASVDTDLDVFLVYDNNTPTDSSDDFAVAGSALDNIANDEPAELFSYTNPTGSTLTFDVVIANFAGPNPERIKYINFGSGSPTEFDTNSSTIFAHPAAINGRAVGAVPYFDRENPESFTSLGPTTILFETDGTPKATPEIRNTPDIAAIDGTDTTFFGSDVDGNGFPNFFGTSAAAPHAAAIAALIKEANPTWTPDQVYDSLESTAEDIYNAGFDDLTGFGLVNAYDAIFGDVVPASLNFTDDFEDGDLPSAYETNTNQAGRIQVTDENSPQGTNHLTLDSSRGLNDLSLNEVILHVDTTGYTDVQLSFDQKEFGDEDNPMSASFSGSENSDGVALSVDGNTWYSLISLTSGEGNTSTTYRTNSFNLSDAATTNGLTLGSDVQIKFQQYDNFPINASDGTDGLAFDNISVAGTLSGTVTGTTGNDNLAGTNGNDTIPGDAGEDFIDSGSGNDNAYGGDGRDLICAHEGDDLLIGGLDTDYLDGGDGNDTLSGGTYDPSGDPIVGTDGAQDSFVGGSGSDVFVLSTDSANDTIYDFEDGLDRLGVFDSLSSNDVTISTNSGNTIITLDSNGDTLATLIGITSVIDSSDFTNLDTP
ncbi:Ca2+-binding protein, RTX toxin (fragment) [Hyella patelloides LEGE 07179]|uniref:Ca2+-binding protein, RTX toxin n=1 Tax=Hyella patelloides LEGE 07179 TaxID=945734 RepID=A0A563VTX0_9CYAN